MVSRKPKWRQVFDKVERAVGLPLEDVAASNRFVEVMAVGIKARRAASSTVWRVVHGVSGTALHAVNIPTRDDVRRLSTNITSLAGEIRAMEQNQRTAARSGAVRPVNSRAAKIRAVDSAHTPALQPSADLTGKDSDDD